jgi:hypothetical protein
MASFNLLQSFPVISTGNQSHSQFLNLTETRRESPVSPDAMECLDCHAREMDRHGRCACCQSEAMFPVRTERSVKMPVVFEN